MSTDIKGVETRIRAAVEKWTLGGGIISDGEWGVVQYDGKWVEDNSRCVTGTACALGAFLFVEQPPAVGTAADPDVEDEELTVAKALGVPEEWVVGFIRGFDNYNLQSEIPADPEAIILGQKLRKEWGLDADA